MLSITPLLLSAMRTGRAGEGIINTYSPSLPGRLAAKQHRETLGHTAERDPSCDHTLGHRIKVGQWFSGCR